MLSYFVLLYDVGIVDALLHKIESGVTMERASSFTMPALSTQNKANHSPHSQDNKYVNLKFLMLVAAL